MLTLYTTAFLLAYGFTRAAFVWLGLIPEEGPWKKK